MNLSQVLAFAVVAAATVSAPAQNGFERLEPESQKVETIIERRSAANNRRVQQPVADDAKLSPELKAKAVGFLRAAGKDAQGLNLTENRVRYQIEAADLLWRHDEKSARDLFLAAMNDFRLIMNQLDAQQQSSEAGEVEDDSLFGFMSGGADDSRQHYAASGVRRNLLLALAKRDGALAFDFLRETARDNFQNWNDDYFESQLAAVVAAHDPTRALQLANQKLQKNQFTGLSEVALEVYRKDQTKGAKFAQDLARKLRAANLGETDGALSTASLLFDHAASSLEHGGANNTALLGDSDLRELAEIVARGYVESKKKYGYIGYGGSLERLKKYAPAAAARLEREMAANDRDGNRGSSDSDAAEVLPPPMPPNANNANSDSGEGSGSGGATVSNIAVGATATATVQGAGQIAASRREQQLEAQTAAFAKLTALASDPNRKISIDEVRQTLRLIRSRAQKMLALTQLAKTAALRGDKETAKVLLAEANEFYIAQPRKAAEMLQNLMLADACAYAEPNRAFVIFENTIAEFNQVAASFARIGDFIGAREIADNGEFNMGSLPKDFLQIPVGGAGTGLGLDKMMKNLANADFARTAALADKFDKPELRLEAKMLIARLLLPLDEEK